MDDNKIMNLIQNKVKNDKQNSSFFISGFVKKKLIAKIRNLGGILKNYL